jgi:hypothetical protein
LRCTTRSTGKGEHRRDEQHHAHHRAHLEVLLADDLLVDIGCQHVKIAADDLGRAEVGDGERKHHEARADEPVAAAGKGHGEEDAQLAGAQRHGRFIKPRVGNSE